jgi:hypothetical protein
MFSTTHTYILCILAADLLSSAIGVSLNMDIYSLSFVL